MALTYGPEIVKLSRDQRIVWAQEMIETIEENLAIDRADHKNECEECQNGELCFDTIVIGPEARARAEMIVRLRGMILRERDDQKYADRAKLQSVDYDNHVDGFCAYWQNLRHRKFRSVNFTCERCGETTAQLQAHHRHYNTLGFEEICDLKALCADCHRIEHGG